MSLSSSSPSSYIVKNPLKATLDELALNIYELASKVTFSVSYIALDILHATNLLHISEYNLYSSRLKVSLTSAGARSIYVGLIASCASCILPLDSLVRGATSAA